MRAIRIGVFRKDDARLVVYQYSYSLCGVLKLADSKPKIRDFREWRQPFDQAVEISPGTVIVMVVDAR